MAYIVMAIVMADSMAYIVMAYIVMAYIAMAYIVMAVTGDRIETTEHVARECGIALPNSER